MKTGSILLFEDDARFAESLGREIKKQVGRSARVDIFEPHLDQIAGNAFEDRLKTEIPQPVGAVSLWVSDRDLSATRHFMGFSESAVSRVANEWAVPVCLYARGSGNDLLDRQRNWTEGRIILDANVGKDEMARQISLVYAGFVQIHSRLKRILTQAKRLNSATLTPARILTKILERPGIADKLALYGSGDQKVLADLLPFAGDQLAERIPRILGYWLWDSVLRFPGIVVSSIAAASYLNISAETFIGNPRISRIFRKALYGGPFADNQSHLWWRSDLDEILVERKVTSGYELCAALGIQTEPSHCCVDPTIPAGFYCMIRKLPVSRQNSKGNISWFPSGADLARISNPDYEELGPWLGLY
jgi:hypothetical protein